MKNAIAVLFLTLLTQSAEARLGETIRECDLRYGTAAKECPIIAPASQGYAYLKNGLVLGIQFRDSKAVGIVAGKLNGTLSLTEAEVLMEANKGESEWEESKEISMSKKWVTKDAKRVAQYDQFQGSLIIMLRDYALDIAKEKESQQKKNLEGF